MRAYTIRPADTLNIGVFREPELSLQSVRVDANGAIAMPLVGPVQVAGLSPRDAEDRISQALRQGYLRNPEVSVNVVEYQSHLVTVEGEVENPGLFTFQPGTRLSGAIALGNGMSRVADRRDIAIFRTLDDGTYIAKFDYTAVQAGTMIDPVLMPGDRVIVGTNGLSQFWQDFLRSLPVFALFTRL